MFRSRLEQNLVYAQEAIDYVSNRVVSINKKGDNKHPDFVSQYEKLCKLRMCEYNLKVDLGLNYTEVSDDFILKHAVNIEKAGIGNCGEQTYLAYAYLVNRGVKNIDIVVLDNHAFIVIDRNQSAQGYDEKKVETWGEDAVVCDPHQEQYFNASFFPCRQYLDLHQQTSSKYKFFTGKPSLVAMQPQAKL